MIEITKTGLHVSVSGAVVYLDNWAFIELAKKDPVRRQRFLDAVHAGVDLLFSVTNAAELSGPRGHSRHALKAFLNEIGPRWFPARLDATEVVKLEAMGRNSVEACIDETFFKSYAADQMRAFASISGNVVPVSDRLFWLGAIVDRVGLQRESIAITSSEFDKVIKDKMSAIWTRSKSDPVFLNHKFPSVPFNPSKRAGFVYHNLLRVMAIEAHSLKKGDGLDFCHAVIASAFSSFAALDTQWKRRLASLPPNPLARIYSPRELDQMVTDMEAWVRRPTQLPLSTLL